ncbi:hypothetical protein EPUS_04575 [Endocarpon pusillum Z07020]|uniref:Uncharacterized protein n=1 Tax=Endocarpon pusillum (strain Z07020 / HMAS-L-300199) TaxID=1263415 RepID=U1HXN9_ENDPU|nr:uncharacterized protein EPUS_04575 [Endocarpon pusillum Z07020]ERF75595.1 hypothetical protein EPUS_04575 [Endocarpon pusillum Z07020]
MQLVSNISVELSTDVACPLWSQLQLRADVHLPHNDLLKDDNGFTALKLEVRQQIAGGNHQPEHACQHSYEVSNGENSKPPAGIPTLVLRAVNIFFTFSCLRTTTLVPQKRSSCEENILPDQTDSPRVSGDGVLNPAGFDEQSIGIDKTQLAASQRFGNAPFLDGFDANNLMIPSAPNQISSDTSADLFSSAFEDDSDETQSIVFSGQESAFVQSQDESREAGFRESSSSCFLSMNALIDGAFRSIICPKPIRTAPGIKMERSNLERGLADIAPSTFSPGYRKAVAARGPLVPTIARFLTSFLQKAKCFRLITKKDELIQQFPKLQSTGNLQTDQTGEEGAKLKEVVKMHLWMTMTNALRDPQPARRLKPLQHFRKSVVVDSNESLDIEQAELECSGFDRESDDQMLEEDYNALFEPIYHDASYDYDMLENLDEEDEADNFEEYEPDLFEEYEEWLRSACEHENTGSTELLFDNNRCCSESEFISQETSTALLSPMLQPQEKFHEPGQVELASDTAPPTHPRIFPVLSLGDLDATTDDGGDGDWTDLLDEADPGESGDVAADRSLARPIASLHDEYEPSFEQWEFDREQGYDAAEPSLSAVPTVLSDSLLLLSPATPWANAPPTKPFSSAKAFKSLAGSKRRSLAKRVLGDAGVVGPAGDLAEAGGDAAGAVLALVAVDQQRLVALVEHEPEDARHRGGRGGDGDVVVLDAGEGHEGGVGGGERVRGQGDDGLEAVGFQGGEVRRLRVRAAVDAGSLSAGRSRRASAVAICLPPW